MPVAEEPSLLHRDLRALGVQPQVTRALHGVGLVNQFVRLCQATALCGHDRRGHQQQAQFFGLDRRRRPPARLASRSDSASASCSSSCAR